MIKTQQPPAQAILKRLRPLYAAAFFQGFVLWYAIEKFFMQTIGFNDESITIATAIYILVMLIANFPFGVLADRWSRKGILYIASIALMAASLICGTSHGFWQYVLGISVWGIFYACYNGTYDSVVYDVMLEETGTSKGFERYYGRIQMYDAVALIIGSLASSTIGKLIGLRADYFLTIVFVSFSIVALYHFREPTLHKKNTTTSLKVHIGDISYALTHGSALLWVVLSIICNIIAMRLVFEFMQLWFIGLNLPVLFYGPAAALFYCGMGVGGFFAHRLRGSHKQVILISLFAIIVSLNLLFKVDVTVIVALMVLSCIIIMTSVITSRYLHDAVPSKIRAGVSSAVSTVGYVAFIPVALGFGVVSRKHSIFAASWFVIGALVAFAIMLSIVAHYRRDTARPALRSASTV